ncbi:hypothetical protein CCF38_004228 [Salmonella enterica]|nr:hypothetical protein [Salmonella enterica]EDX4822748.1 hypothetical protein [Salmonella enterica subsp. arizonae]EDX6771470.1 hypothetical protein [Salmonella enterica subsp. arizonae serovar 53:z4,z24:-]EEJ5250569.1 hypothetical protein [Salmonella enterica subsp. enterica serovar Waycross]EGE4649799.1 hypothetical protein [Salmonella enterica subsp. arizonae serovar 41:z4,z23:- str. 01-0089]
MYRAMRFLHSSALSRPHRICCRSGGAEDGITRGKKAKETDVDAGQIRG